MDEEEREAAMNKSQHKGKNPGIIGTVRGLTSLPFIMLWILIAIVAYFRMDIPEPPVHFYGVMFDAGSMGSRVHAFKFKKDKGKHFDLQDSLFEYNFKALSSFKKTPKLAAQSLQPLLQAALEYVPKTHWANTTVALKATAGLRFLRVEEANAILDSARDLLTHSPFAFDPANVRILEGGDEGFYSWFTLNFLKGVLGDDGQMYGAMDLGGGSTQLTFATTITTPSTSPIELEEVDLFGRQFNIYSHSYLGLGLMAGRLQTLQTSPSLDKTVFISPCLVEGEQETWTYNDTEYTVVGRRPDHGTTRFRACHGAAEEVVQQYDMYAPAELSTLKITLFSFYYDRALDAKLITTDHKYTVRVREFLEAAKHECAHPQGNVFLCLDLCYISALFEDGFRFDMDKEIYFQKEEKGFELSWALGAMFSLLQEC